MSEIHMENSRYKFRVWDKDFLAMKSPRNLKRLMMSEAINEDVIDDYIFMQFTGLLDKNGKEIYSDDLLRSGKTSLIYRVEWVDGEARFAAFCINAKKDFVMNYYSWCESEVIGNIYENKELLDA